ncbi:hydrolase [Rhodococcoides trifolii]|uniref:Hydrolase n=1 Tax=Rhodococcoides trifolii TaxID=908250 RepID=A0A917G7Y8_9NOCA|nr:fumarylacetoacetate hydrolase family protein [Rhodococcus trifolii]GGG26958.1 hydrolase [Rhodococcus trifolii]
MSESDSPTGLSEGTFGLARLSCFGESAFNALVRPGGEVVDISSRYSSSTALYAKWDATFDELDSVSRQARSTGVDFADYDVLPPVERPQIFCAGSNYRQHAAEMYTFNAGAYQEERLPGEKDEAFFARNSQFVTEKRAKGMPFIWLATFGSMVGPHDDIALPPVGTAHDWEAELTVVVAGGSPRMMNPDEAGLYIAGYTIGNDMHTGDLYSRTDIKWNADWIAKQQPTFKQVGPMVVPKQFFPVLGSMQIELDLNGDRMQDWPADDMIFSPEEYLAYASERVALLGGDLLMMGSPPGNGGVHGGRWLTPGDVVDIRIDGLGSQRHNVVAEDTDGRTPFFGMPPYDVCSR